jgi:hypothetical protein
MIEFSCFVFGPLEVGFSDCISFKPDIHIWFESGQVASGLSETLIESCVLVGVLWWGYISYFLCLLIYSM